MVIDKKLPSEALFLFLLVYSCECLREGSLFIGMAGSCKKRHFFAEKCRVLKKFAVKLRALNAFNLSNCEREA